MSEFPAHLIGLCGEALTVQFRANNIMDEVEQLENHANLLGRMNARAIDVGRARLAAVSRGREYAEELIALGNKLRQVSDATRQVLEETISKLEGR